MTGSTETSLDQRVAALEAALEEMRHPLISVAPPGAGVPDEDAARFREEFSRLAGQPWQPRVLPSPPPLGRDELRALLRESATVVKPGELLVVNTPESWTPEHVGEGQRYVNAWLEDNAPGVQVLLLMHADDVAVIQADTDAAFTARVMDAINALDVRVVVRNGAGPAVRAEPGGP